MLDQSYNLNCCFFGCDVISDLCLFQDIVLLNSCSKFSKRLMLLFTDKFTTGKQSLALVILKSTSVMLL